MLLIAPTTIITLCFLYCANLTSSSGYFQECEGLQAILIDWQGGFLGSVANDLMWALYPFLESRQNDKVVSMQVCRVTGG